MQQFDFPEIFYMVSFWLVYIRIVRRNNSLPPYVFMYGPDIRIIWQEKIGSGGHQRILCQHIRFRSDFNGKSITANELVSDK